MINIGNDPIDNILIGDTQVDKVYLGTDVVWEHQQPVTKPYLKFKALEAGTFTLTIPSGVTDSALTSISYSTDGGNTWTTTQNTSSNVTITTPTIAAGDYILWKGTGSAMATSNTVYSNFSSTGNFAASGNIMSLLFENTFEDEKVLPNTSYIFAKLFKDCTGMTTPPELPATTLRNRCYGNMFDGCTSLTSMPMLPATILADGCYSEMFEGCTSLVVAPRIKARTFYNSSCYMMFDGCSSLTTIPEFVPEVVGPNCCRYMFRRCTSLTVAPDLPATTAPTACYQQMFTECTGLVTIPSRLPATSLGTNCYNSMFNGCSAITTAPELPATTLAERCYASMFNGCSSLVNIQNELPSTTLAKFCYQQMFYMCSSLQKAPDLPALTLVQGCYYEMFYGCGKITSLKCLATDISASNCTYQWLRNVADSATFIKNSEMSSWTRDWSGIPTNWTIEDYVITKPYLKFKALESGTFTLTIPASITSNELSSISYSTDNGSSWVATQNSDSVVTITTPTISAGSSVLWKGSGTAMGNTNEGCRFASTCRFECSGNIMSLLYGDNFEEQITIPSSYCFYSLFYTCTNLEKAPELPATTLTYACYKSMFYGCSNLTTAPVLPATTVTFESYAYMFYHCSNLNYIKMMATAVRYNTLSNWVNSVSASGTFVKNVNATWSGTGTSGIPSGWTVQTASS